jgi:hypothetical protein
LGDRRLTQRLVQLATQRGAMPNASIAQSCQDLAGVRGAYRFYDHDGIKMDHILGSHYQNTLKRCREQKVVLAVQDTTQVNLSHHPHTQGLGYLNDLEHSGYFVHSTLMVTPERIPLGLIQEQVWVRDPAEYGKKQKRHERATEEKESQKWLTSLDEVAKLQKELPGTLLVSVGDSEADMYALFAEASQLKQAFLIRACRDRLVESDAERHLWQGVAQQPAAGTLDVVIPRQEDRAARTASLTIRCVQVRLKVPRREVERSELSEVSAWAIWAKEETPPPDAKPIEWKLLTNVPTDHFDQACERVAWYSCRWVIEMFHRVLKSGCRIEERQFDDFDNIQRFLAVDSVVAWRVLYLTLLSREVPEMSCTALFEAYEWQALYCFVHKTAKFPDIPPTLAEVVRWIARLGGFVASSHHQPGTTVLWQGMQRLTDISQAWLLFHAHP